MTNLDKYEKELLKLVVLESGVGKCKGELRSCRRIDCYSCDFRNKEYKEDADYGCEKRLAEWLDEEYVKKTKLTQFEYDLLTSWSGGIRLCNVEPLIAMINKGYFKSVNPNLNIYKILENCEVVKND